MEQRKPYARRVNFEYALIQGLHWAGYCGIVSFAAVYLQARGYSNVALGHVLAYGYVLGLVLPQLLAAWIDRSRSVTAYHCLWGLFAAQTVLVLVLRHMPGQGMSVSVLSCLLIGIEVSLNPLNTEIGAELERKICHINYGMARGTGSIVYAPVAILLGRLIDNAGVRTLPWIELAGIVLQCAALVLMTVSTRAIPASADESAGEKAAASRLPDFIRDNRRFLIMLLGAAFLFFAHNLVNNYMINVVRHVGGDTSDMGALSGCTALVEIPMMFLYDRFARRVGCAFTVRFAAAMFALKALFIALASSMAGLYCANLLQCVSFAVITPALVRYADLHVSRRDSAKAQAVAFGTVTVGNIVSSFLGGALFDGTSVRSTLLICFAAAVLGAVICIIFTERDN